MPQDIYDKIMMLAKRRGFIYPSFEIYGGVAGFYDYGPLGSRLKQHIEDLWRSFYLLKDNIAVSDNGEKIILGAYNLSNQIMKIFIFNCDSNDTVLTFPIAFDYPYPTVRFNLLDVSYDGSIVLLANDHEALIVDTTIPAIRWRGDPDENPYNEFICVAAISGDGSVLVGRYYNYSLHGQCLKAFKWNETENDYEVLWDQFIISGWFCWKNLHTLEVSDDGSTVMVSFNSLDDLESKLFAYDINSGTLLWEDHVIVGGEYPICILDICLSKDGSKGIVAHADDEFGVNPEVKVYNRKSSTPFFTIDTPATALSVDISPDGELAIAGGDLLPSYFVTAGQILFGIELDFSNDAPSPPTINGPTSGTAGVEYEYTFVTNDPEEDNISYYVDWGDNTSTGWTDFVVSGTEITLVHTWEEQGIYTIRAKARDIHYAESDWGTLEVEMPLDLQVEVSNQQLLKTIFQRFISFKQNVKSPLTS